MVGVGRAKDLLIGERGRAGLEGTGPGRFHVYKGVIADYFEQLGRGQGARAPAERARDPRLAEEGRASQ